MLFTDGATGHNSYELHLFEDIVGGFNEKLKVLVNRNVITSTSKETFSGEERKHVSKKALL